MKRIGRWSAALWMLAACRIASAAADTANRLEMRAVGRAWLEQRISAGGTWGGSRVPEIIGEQPVAQGDVLLGCRFTIAPQGFILVPARTELCPIWFYAEVGSIDFATEEIAAEVLRGRLALATRVVSGEVDVSDPGPRAEIAAASEKNRSRWNRLLASGSARGNPDPAPVIGLGPLLSTTWHQGAPFNLLCPVGRGGQRCVAGCTPVAGAQIARYHASPSGGSPHQVDHVWFGDRCASPPMAPVWLHADFRNPYEWARMPDTCLGSCGSAADSAVAELVYELGVASGADYSVCGTSASLRSVARALENCFGYEPSNETVSRDQVADAHEWFTMLQAEINALRPVLYGFTYASGAGNHALVCDGWRIEEGIEYLSLNLGGGGVTGWYASDDNGLSVPMQDYAILHLTPAPQVVTIRPQGDGDHPTIQAAIDVVRSGATIELAEGVFRGPGNRDLVFRGKRITLRSIGDDPAACTLDCEGTAAAPHRALVFDQPAGSNPVIRGLTIRNGWAAGDSAGIPARGGAVLCRADCFPRIQNCVFVNNSAEQGGAIGGTGASPSIDGCVFWRNVASEGGAFAMTEGGEARISASTFCENSGVSGSALYAGPQSRIVLARSIASHNRIGGAVAFEGSGAVALTCCDLYGNEGGDWNGGIAGQLGRDGNFSADPRFCQAGAGDLRLHAASPCTGSDCGLLGARPVGCGELRWDVGSGPQYEYHTIGEALAAARPGGRIVLVDGFYTGDGNRDLTIPCRGLTIESRSGVPDSCVLDVGGSAAEPHRAFRVSATPGVTFRGITVRHGWFPSGGAIHLESADSTRLYDCVFEECRAGGAFPDSGGGALLITGHSGHGGRTEIRDCRFEGCSSATDGGAVRLRYRGLADTTFVVGCSFLSNQAEGSGGAFAGSLVQVRVKDSVFYDNVAVSGGAFLIDAQSQVALHSCTLVANAASGKGACVYVDNEWSQADFRRSIFAYSVGRPPVECSASIGTTVSLVCCDVWPESEGGWDGCMADWRAGSIRRDPRFCAAGRDDFRLRPSSPCLPDQPGNQGCGRIGAAYETCLAPGPTADSTAVSILRCAPNPFRQEMAIDYYAPAEAATLALEISIYTAAGRRVRTLYRGAGRAGEQREHWDGRDHSGRRVESGIYFCRVQLGAAEAAERLIVLR